MKSNDWRHKNVARYTPGNTKILYFFNCLLDGMHTKRTDFVTFALRRSDCSLAGSFLSEAVLSGRTERLTQGNKTVLLCGKIPFLFSSVCQIPFRLFFRKNRLFFLKIPSLETAISCLAFWVLRMASSSFL